MISIRNINTMVIKYIPSHILKCLKESLTTKVSPARWAVNIIESGLNTTEAQGFYS